MRQILTSFCLLAALCFAGCARQPAESDVQGVLSYGEASAIAKEWARSIGGKAYRVTPTDSMEGILSDYEIAICIPRWDAVAVGQVVLRVIDGVVVIHQVVAESGGFFKTAGFNNPRTDIGWMGRNDYLGTYTGRILYHDS